MAGGELSCGNRGLSEFNTTMLVTIGIELTLTTDYKTWEILR